MYGGTITDDTPISDVFGPRSIKILNLKKNDIDLLTLSADILDIYFENDTDGIKQIILDYQFLTNNNPTIHESDIEEIIIRRLLLDKSVIPVIDTIGLNKSNKQDNINIQVKKRTMCIYYNSGKYYKIYVSNDEIIHLIGFVINPKKQYTSVIELYDTHFINNIRPNGSTCEGKSIKSHFVIGDYTSDVMSVELARYGATISPIILPDNVVYINKSDIFPIIQYSQDMVNKLKIQIKHLMQIHSELNTHYIYDINKQRSVDTNNAIMQIEFANHETFQSKVINNSLKELSKKLELPSKMFDRYKLNILSELHSNNVLILYYYQLHKITNEIDNTINKINIKNIEQSKQNEIEIQYFKNTAKAQRYLLIIQNKFGNLASEISNKLIKNNRIDEPSAVFELLDNTTRKLIESEYLKMELKWKGVINNKCKHIQLLYKFTHTINIKNKYDILNQLRTIYYKNPVDPDPKNNHEMISCKVCGYNIICPHTDNMIEMQYNKRAYGVILEFLQKYSVKIGVDENDLNGFSSYYCKICNEFISNLYETKERDDTFRSYENSPVQKIMWFESLRAIDNVIFNKLVDVKSIAKTIIDKCYPIYQKIETNIVKSTKYRYDENNIPPEVNIYIIIIIYAYVLNMIRLSHNSLSNEQLGFKNIPPNSKMSKFAEAIVSHLLANYGKIIQYSDLDNDIVIQRFKEIYKEIMTFGEVAISNQNNINISIDDIISVNPIYKYAAIIAQNTIKTPNDEFKTVVGISLHEALENTYTKNKNALTQKLLGINKNNQKTFIQYPKDIDIKYFYGIKDINFWRNIYKQPHPSKEDLNNEDILKTFATKINKPDDQSITNFSRSITEFIRGSNNILSDRPNGSARRGNTSKSKWNNVILASKSVKRKSYDLIREYLGVDSQEQMDKYNKKFYEFKMEENSFLIMRAIANSKVFNNIKFNKSRSFDYLINKSHDMKLSYTYDENGIKHSWINNFKKNIYIYDNGPEYTYTNTDINNMLKTNINKPNKIIDIKCPYCNIKLSEIDTIDTQKIIDSLAIKYKINNFFIFFTSRCPLGGIHLFKNMNDTRQECTKCKITSALIYTYADIDMVKESYEFYSKYKNEYDKLQNESVVHISKTHHNNILLDGSNGSARRGNHKIVDVDHTKYGIDKWKFSYNKLTELSMLMNIDIKILETLGYTEGADMSVVLNTEKYFGEVISNNSHVVQNLKSIIILVITLFNQFRYSSTNTMSDGRITTILDKFKDNENFVNYSEYFINNDHINNIFNRFNTNLINMINLRTPNDIVSFQIETFCDILLEIAKINDIKYEWVKKLSYEVSKYILTNVLESEKMMTKFKNFNLKAYVDDNIIIDS